MTEFEPNREAKRIAEYLRALGHYDLAKDVLLGLHWEWNPNAREGSRREDGKKR